MEGKDYSKELNKRMRLYRKKKKQEYEEKFQKKVEEFYKENEYKLDCLVSVDQEAELMCWDMFVTMCQVANNNYPMVSNVAGRILGMDVIVHRDLDKPVTIHIKKIQPKKKKKLMEVIKDGIKNSPRRVGRFTKRDKKKN